jgi:protease PrsW
MTTTATATATTTLVFECLEGKDVHFTVSLEPNQSVTLGPPNTNAIAIKELENMEGSIVLSYRNNLLHIETLGGTVPVKINTSNVTSGTIRTGDIVWIGRSLWRANYPTTAVSGGNTSFDTTAIRNHFNNLIGLEDLKDFKLRSIFSQVFKKHSPSEMEDQLVTGTIRNTPALTEIEIGWAKPWLFFRLLALSIILDFVLIMCFHTFPNLNLLPGIIFIGSFAVPIATLVFFLEMNVPRNISIFIVMALMFAGGVASLVITLIFFDRLEFLSQAMGASSAGIIEESAKILCVILLLRKVKRYRWILNGLLIGAAIGTGFAAFESAGYALNSILQTQSFDQGVDNIVLRGVLAPFGHIIWTGNAAAALWLVKGDRNFEWSMLKDMRFIRVFLSSVILHFLWNLNFTIFYLPFVADVKMLILGVIGWAITLRLIQAGLKQLNEARRLEVEQLEIKRQQ